MSALLSSRTDGLCIRTDLYPMSQLTNRGVTWCHAYVVPKYRHCPVPVFASTSLAVISNEQLERVALDPQAWISQVSGRPQSSLNSNWQTIQV